MAERVRQMMKKSSSKASTSKGSVNHLATTPYRFKIDLFISYAENIKSLSEACITLERRGKTEATNAVNVVDGKAVFRQQISMECTLFRKNPGKGKHQDNAHEELFNFDEKKAKLYLRKGGPQGKAVAKLALNLSQYIKGTNSTVFADMKLSDGTVVVTKVEATMIALEKKKKFGSFTGSGFSDGTSVDDSLCGDEEDLESAQRLSEIPSPPSVIPLTPRNAMSPVTSTTSSPPNVSSQPSFAKRKSAVSAATPNFRISMSPQAFAAATAPFAEPPPTPDSKLKPQKSGRSRNKDSEGIRESGSIREKLKKFKLPGKKEKAEKHEKAGNHDNGEPSDLVFERHNTDLGHKRNDSSVQFSMPLSTPNSAEVSPPSNSTTALFTATSTHSGENTEMKELKKQLDSLKKENHKLKKAKNAAMEEIEALRDELKTCEEQLESIERKDKPKNSATDAKIAKLQSKLKERDKKIEELKSQNENLMEEMEEQHSEMRTVSKRLEEHDRQKIRTEAAIEEKRRAEQERLEQIRIEQARLDQSRLEEKRRREAEEERANSRKNGQEEDGELVRSLKKKIEELEVALEREPTFMDVVNELKVMKMTVALTNMEKEQALFQLQSMRNQFRELDSGE